MKYHSSPGEENSREREAADTEYTMSLFPILLNVVSLNYLPNSEDGCKYHFLSTCYGPGTMQNEHTSLLSFIALGAIPVKSLLLQSI